MTARLGGEGSVHRHAGVLGPWAVSSSACLGTGCGRRRVCFPLRAQFLLHGSKCGLAKVATGTGFCFCFLVSYLSSDFSFLSYFLLWYFSSLGIIFNRKTGLTAVAFLFHLCLSEALKYLLKSAISDFSSFLLRQGWESLLFNPQKKRIE